MSDVASFFDKYAANSLAFLTGLNGHERVAEQAFSDLLRFVLQVALRNDGNAAEPLAIDFNWSACRSIMHCPLSTSTGVDLRFYDKCTNAVGDEVIVGYCTSLDCRRNGLAA
jgi:hypothetical protein